MSITEGFIRKREKDNRLPPGQYLTSDFPVLSIGLTPKVERSEWSLDIVGHGIKTSFSWSELMTLPQVEIVEDIHCVTAWSKYDTNWSGVSVRNLFEKIEVPDTVTHILAHSADGYTTNLPIEDVTKKNVLIATTYDGEEIEAAHGGPVRLVVPHLYFWKSAKWLTKIELLDFDQQGFWETRGYHNYGDPWLEERYED